MAQLTAKIVGKGKDQVLVLEIPMNPPRDSGSGKTTVVATTGGNQVTECEYPGLGPIVVGVNAYVRKK
jgi:hypothetical protein